MKDTNHRWAKQNSQPTEMHSFSFLLPPSAVHTAKLSLGSRLTVPVPVLRCETVWGRGEGGVVLPIIAGLSLLVQQGPYSLVVVIKPVRMEFLFGP